MTNHREQFGNYRLIGDLGQGGFAKVYLGKHVYLGALAAIKVLHAHLVSSLLIPYNEYGGTGGQFGFPKSPARATEQNAQLLLQEFEGGLICVLQEKTPEQ